MNPKEKSGKSEREIARFLTKWLTGQEKKLAFWRTPGSGGVATVNVGNKAISGDIMALTVEAAFLTDKFNLEVKDGYGKTDLFQHIKGIKNFNIEIFWNQCVKDANDNDKEPMLIFRRKNGPWTISINSKTKLEIKDQLVDISTIKIYFTNGLPDLYIYDMKRFFEAIKPEIWKQN